MDLSKNVNIARISLEVKQNSRIIAFLSMQPYRGTIENLSKSLPRPVFPVEVHLQ